MKLDSIDMNKDKELQKLKAENFLIVCGGTTAGVVLAFILCWGIIPKSVLCAHHKCNHYVGPKDKKPNFLDEMAELYKDYHIEIANIPFIAYKMCQDRAKQRLQDFNDKQRI